MWEYKFFGSSSSPSCSVIQSGDPEDSPIAWRLSQKQGRQKKMEATAKNVNHLEEDYVMNADND